MGYIGRLRSENCLKSIQSHNLLPAHSFKERVNQSFNVNLSVKDVLSICPYFTKHHVGSDYSWMYFYKKDYCFTPIEIHKIIKLNEYKNIPNNSQIKHELKSKNKGEIHNVSR